jgi:hypothetical protein
MSATTCSNKNGTEGLCVTTRSPSAFFCFGVRRTVYSC